MRPHSDTESGVDREVYPVFPKRMQPVAPLTPRNGEQLTIVGMTAGIEVNSSTCSVPIEL